MSPHERDSGFTMIELLVTMVLLGIMMAIAVGGYTSWAKASGQSGEARELQSVMRQAQQRAITEGRAICLQFNGTQSYSVYRGACAGTKTLVLGPFQSDSSTTRFTPAPSTYPGSSCTATGATFYARGTAAECALTVTRTDASKVYVLKVEGLTGRVSLS